MDLPTPGGAAGGSNLLQMFAQIPSDAFEGVAPPTEQFVDWLHGRAQTSKPSDLHHQLGFGESQSSPGNHRHNGKDSLKIIPDGEYTLSVNLTAGASNTDIVTAINKLNDLCRTYLGSN
jgi:hypothetical protein